MPRDGEEKDKLQNQNRERKKLDQVRAHEKKCQTNQDIRDDKEYG